MEKPLLTLIELAAAAKSFCDIPHTYREIFGTTDGKAIGTFIEHKLRDSLDATYLVQLGN